MSAEEDTELRDLVAKTLENNGVLAKIRAELRASVILALEEQESCSAPLENKALKEYLKTPQAALGLCVVREFLEYLELDFTLCVYNTETSHGKGYEYTGRNKLIKDLQIQSLSGKKGPLLSHILQIAQESKGVHDNRKEETQYVVSNSNMSPGGDPQYHSSNDLGNSLDSSNLSPAPLNRTFTSDGATVKGLLIPSSDAVDNKANTAQLQKQSSLSLEPQINVTEKHNNANALENSTSQLPSSAQDAGLHLAGISNGNFLPTNVSGNKTSDALSSGRKQNSDEPVHSKMFQKEVKNSMASLNDLPPIDGLQGRRNFNKASINLLDFGSPQDDYEEDFLSTDSSAAVDNSKSHSQNKISTNKQGTNKKDQSFGKKISKESIEKDNSEKTPNSPVGSISEDIDDNTNSGVDELLNSTASTENTVDNTISHIRSKFADYMEDV